MGPERRAGGRAVGVGARACRLSAGGVGTHGPSRLRGCGGAEKTQPVRRLAPEDDELVPLGEDPGGEFEMAPKGTSNGGEDSDDD